MNIEEKFDRTLSSKIKQLVDEAGDDAYDIGSWESFDKINNNGKGYSIKFLWIGIAASFLMAMSFNTVFTSGYKNVLMPNENSEASLNFAPEGDGFKENNSFVLSQFSDEMIDKDKESCSPNKANPLSPFSATPSFSNERAIFVTAIPASILFTQLEKTGGNHWGNTSLSIGNPRERGSLNREVKLGVNLFSSVNLQKHSYSGSNYGAGLAIEIPVLSKLSINSGLNISHQDINFKSFNTTPLPGESRNGFYTKAKLLTLDLPMNLKYNFLKRKKKELFVSAGVSSVAFVKSKFSQKSEVAEVSSDKSFEKIGIAKFLNFSVGVEVPVEKNVSVVVEPYVKYALGGVTSKDINSSSAGVNLRFNYSLAKLN